MRVQAWHSLKRRVYLELSNGPLRKISKYLLTPAVAIPVSGLIMVFSAMAYSATNDRPRTT